MKPDQLNESEFKPGHILDSAEAIISAVRDLGYIEMEPHDVESIEGGEIEFLKKLKEAGMEEEMKGLYYDPKRIEFKSVDNYKGIDPEYVKEGWEVLRRVTGGLYTLMVREIK